jgi:hypothetical protein
VIQIYRVKNLKERNLPNGNQTLPVREEIARRAYELYEARGEQNGSDVDDWLTAEREVQEQLPRSSGWPIAEGKVQFPRMLSEDSSTNSSPENHGSFRLPRQFLVSNAD